MKQVAILIALLMVAVAVAADDSAALEPIRAPQEANLLRNPGFEAGDDAPEGWVKFPRGARGITCAWDDAKFHSGKRSARIEGIGLGMWQQIVDVEPGRVYVLKAYVAFQEVTAKGRCCLQVVFRSRANALIKMIYWPGHTGSRDFALDFPPALKVRAPDNAARAEVNLFLKGRGQAWFDDVFFGPSPVGEISGTVRSGDKPLAGARVQIWGDPWGKQYEAVTAADGKYSLTEIPVAFPRYVLLTSGEGYRTQPIGDVEVKSGGRTTVDFELKPGRDPDNLHVRFGTLGLQRFLPGVKIPDGAVIPKDPTGYPEAVRSYLEPDEYIRADHPDVVAKAKQIVATLSETDRTDTRKVAWAIYTWVSRNIDHDGVFSVKGHGGLDQPFRDVTSGIWQTISGNGWCWGSSFRDWCYRPNELLKVSSGICVEHAWLVAAMFRSMNVPARAAVGSYEFYAQGRTGNGVWIHGSTTSGRTQYRERGRLGSGFEGLAPERRFSVLSRPVLHEDWNVEHKGLWRERHPWSERYEGTPTGYRKAVKDMAQFAETGKAPRNVPPTRRGGKSSDLYMINYSDVTISLLTVGDQRSLDVLFPLASASTDETPKADNRYWTNHPECVKRIWVEKITNPPVKGAEHWFHIEFDLTTLLD